MKPFLHVFLWSCALSAVSAEPVQEPRVAVDELAANVYLYTYDTHRSLFVITDDAVLATDPQSPEAAARYLEEIRKLSSAPLRYVVYSHHHGDHVSGASALGGEPIIIAHRNAARRLAEEPTADILRPQVSFSDEARLYLGDLEVRLIYPGPSETDGNIIVFLPERKVAFMVDAVSVRTLPWRNLAGGNPEEWIEALRKLQSLDFDILAPGHGPTGDTSHVQEYIDYFTDLTRAVRERIERGESLDEIQRTLELPRYRDWGRYDEHFDLNIEGVYRELTKSSR